jgi:LysR family glycine cleavage system transcriptional activator
MAARPPLIALHVFCAVVQDGGFRQAAQTLHLTPGAISRQIQTLEAHLKQVLFDRGSGNAARLTQQGQDLYERVAGRMADLVEALDPLGGDRRHAPILVDTSVTLAMHWLIPQLHAFRQRHPHLQVHVRTVDGAINPCAPVDVFIRRDPAELRGLPAQAFLAEHSVLVAGATFAAWPASPLAADGGWLLEVPRIGMRSRRDLWPSWGQAHGIAARPLEPTLEFDNTVLAIQAAVQGLGVLVVPHAFIETMLASGALRLLDPTSIETGSYSFALGRRQDSSRVAVFTDWLKACGAR